MDNLIRAFDRSPRPLDSEPGPPGRRLPFGRATRRHPRLARAVRALAPIALACGVTAACSRGDATADDGGAPRGTLTLTGSSTVAPLAAEIARRFEELHPGVRIDVQSGGSSRGIADAASGVADLGMASRALAAGETDQGLIAHRVAADGVGLIVHASRPLDGLTRDQVVAVYTKATTRWSELEAGDGTIVVANKAAGRATLEVFLAAFGLDEADIRADVIVGENQQAIKTVAGNRDAIAYVSIGEAEREIELGTPIRLLAADGIAATTANVASGAYGVTRPLNLVTRGAPEGLAAEFVAFARSPDVDDLVRAAQFVPLPR